ncbi:xanthine dehydrogenase family protein molybdopterin-binding subunit [Accumulibacter sp.]|uniref:xanthine dehydrogenase family protein molybdopterin-binding subunit n=1 Tax=Accumulibacter sp. TaxID=2053492 RepID=UPI0025DA2F16|nr:molybdopterin cofactor-binding domain-containing protein [Accumulibacter sp.]MCM8594017.1 molybdopterin-dependent oxidoreductase [Accumulibacter sp.]MCM8627570.1 molybdopterin-dependent oxidoreductase [Accumulibacter sp.]MDS4048159.1 molybdopterin cofactor-binding domain-containing protein [Accumulibacter sp.]
MSIVLSRREFIRVSAAIGGGMALEFSLPGVARAFPGAPIGEINAWIVIHPDDRVVIRIARSEMGQGTLTALAQLVAEELDCDWAKVDTEFASPNEHIRRNRVWGSMSTGGSMGVRSSQDTVRRAGASAREMLIGAAAARWQVSASECSAANGLVTHRPTGRMLRYGELAAEAAKLAPPKEVSLRDPAAWKIAGKSLQRLDIPDKVLGRPVFGVDVALPGMLHASIAQCPVFGGRLRHVDSQAAEAMRGVRKVIRREGFVAVVADSWWRANEALKKLRIDWDHRGNGQANNETIAAMLGEGLAARNLPEARRVGDAPAALAGAARIVEAEYRSPYLNHATLEPQTCTAWFRSDGFLEVWTSTQNGEASLAAAAEEAGLPLERVEVHKMMLGGGFGRRGGPQDFVRQGVAIASELRGTPVKLMWSRQEDMQHGFYRPASIVRLRAGLDAQGRVVALHTRIACPSILTVLMPGSLGKEGIDFTAVRGFSDMPYAVANQQVDYAMRNGHVPVGFWRAPGQQNSFYRESFIDELALAAGRDPVAYRLAMLEPGDRNRLVLEAVARAAGWGSPLPAGVYRGVAIADGFGSYTAMVAEVSVGAEGNAKVRRIVVAIDSGYVVNPDNCRAQAESNVVYGLGSILYQQNNVRNGRIVETNFHDFRLPRISEMPVVEVVLAPTGGFWGGHGEPAILPLAPAVCNALFAATGRRIRSLPLSDHDLRRV